MSTAYKIVQDAGVKVRWRLTRTPSVAVDSRTGQEVPMFKVVLEEKRFLPLAPGARARKSTWIVVLDIPVTQKGYPDMMTTLRLKYPLSGALLVREVMDT